jgi:hypothetical protein
MGEHRPDRRLHRCTSLELARVTKDFRRGSRLPAHGRVRLPG